MKKTLMVCAMGGAMAAFAGYEATTNDGQVVFSVTPGAAAENTTTESYLAADGINSLEFRVPGGQFYFYPTLASTYTGGTFINGGQVYVNQSNAFGPGDVTIGDSSSLMMSSGGNLVFDNKVVFSQINSYAVAFNGASVTFRKLGTTGSGHRVTIGRVGADGESTATLALDGSDALSQVQMTGRLGLTLDGGTVIARSDAESPFFKDVHGNAAVTVSGKGVAFETEAGADVELGTDFTFSRRNDTDVFEELRTDDWSFESGLGAWSFTHGSGAGDVTSSGVKDNGGAFDTNGADVWATTNGTKYVMLRRGAMISRSVEFPEAGTWRVKFEVGCRPGNNSYSLSMTPQVLVDGAVVKTFPQLGAQADRHPFAEKVTDAFELTAGAHTIGIRLANVGQIDPNGSMNFDAIRFERVAEVSRIGAVVKRGEGTMRLDGAAFNGDARFEVEEGVLDLLGTTLDAGDELHVGCTGTLRIRDLADSPIVNGSFENVASPVKDFTATSPQGWTVSKVQATELNTNGSGLQGNGGNVSDTEPVTVYGTVTAALREHSKLQQTFTVAKAGTYRISFVQACRKALYSFSMGVTVELDGETVYTSPSHTEKYGYERNEFEIALSAGSHTLAFVTGEPHTRVSAGAMVFIDDVSVRRLAANDIRECSVDMVPGSTLILDNTAELKIRDFKFDGVGVIGGRAELEEAGLTIVGNGSIKVGEKPLMFIIR